MSTFYRQRFIQIPESLPVSRTINPYWDTMRTIPGNEIDWEYEHVWSPDWTGTWRLENPIDRNELCGQYAWAIPDPDSLDFVRQHIGEHGGVEMGAGTGYWCWQLAQLGADMLAYDIAPPHITGTNHYHSPRNKDHSATTGELRPVYFDVLPGQPEILSLYPERTLFLCWPPMSEMAGDCLKAYQGKRLVYIGEGDGGCTADEAFFTHLTENWQEVASHRPIQWWGIHDYITVYEREV